jgi:hypothetical protein
MAYYALRIATQPLRTQPVRTIMARAASSAIERGYEVHLTTDGVVDAEIIDLIPSPTLRAILTSILNRVDEGAEHPVCLELYEVDAISDALAAYDEAVSG